LHYAEVLDHGSDKPKHVEDSLKNKLDNLNSSVNVWLCKNDYETIGRMHHCANFFLRFMKIILNAFLISPRRAICPAHPDISGGQQKV
jgi:hypothetical protein